MDLNELEFEVILVKVAAIGLGKKHLGAKLSDVTDHLFKLEGQYGVHPAGEGTVYN